MINFFRKSRQLMVKENSFTKYMTYAIGEITLIVVGILIALQIDSWNELQKAKHIEIERYEKVLKDLKIDSKELNLRLLHTKTKVDLIYDLYEGLKEGQRKESANYDFLFTSVFYYSIIANNHKSHLDQILNDQVKEELNGYFREIEIVSISVEEMNQDIMAFRKFTSQNGLQRYDRMFGKNKYVLMDLNAEPIFDYNKSLKYKSKDAFLSILSSSRMSTANAVQRFEMLIKSNQKMISNIESLLTKKDEN